MTDYHWIALALFFSISPLTGALIFMAHRVRGMVAVNVTQPPITVNQPPIEVRPDITVQAPTALIPEHVTELLRLIEERLKPAQVKLSDSEVSAIIKEAVELAEKTSFKGYDKFRVAKDFVETRMKTLNAELDPRDVALRIEASVATLP